MTIAIYQCGYGVFGLGETLAEAVDETNLILGEDQKIEQAAVLKGSAKDEWGCLYWLPCTDDLADCATDFGGQVDHFINKDGFLDLIDNK